MKIYVLGSLEARYPIIMRVKAMILIIIKLMKMRRVNTVSGCPPKTHAFLSEAFVREMRYRLCEYG